MSVMGPVAMLLLLFNYFKVLCQQKCELKLSLGFSNDKSFSAVAVESIINTYHLISRIRAIKKINYIA